MKINDLHIEGTKSITTSYFSWNEEILLSEISGTSRFYRFEVNRLGCHTRELLELYSFRVKGALVFMCLSKKVFLMLEIYLALCRQQGIP